MRTAETSIRAATQKGVNDEQAIGLVLSAADEALKRVKATGEPAAIQTYNAALEVLTRRMFSGLRRPQFGDAFPVNGHSYSVRWAPPGRGTWYGPDFEEVRLASALKRKQFREVKAQQGIGAPVVAVDKVPRGQKRFMPDDGWPIAATLTAEFSGAPGRRMATLTLHDSRERASAKIGGSIRPLAANYTAPLQHLYPRNDEFTSGLRGLFLPDTLQVGDRLTLLEPYQPDRIPVVLIHGLISTPQMWRDVLNELVSDPAIRDRYQFWTYYYPTASPISYSAKLLRDDLRDAMKKYRVRGNLILIGHSMGGILSRLQVTDSGDEFWDTTFRSRAEELRRRKRVWKVASPWFYFAANPRVERVVFISTPHRGSELSEGFLGRMLVSILKAPVAVTKLVTSVLTLEELKSLSYGPFGAGVPTSVRGLSPQNPVLLAMSEKPVEATFHSIIGDRGRGDTPHSTDGVVPYRSSHVKGAASELIVPDNHGAYDHPMTIAELKRILRLHARAER
ncbi:MAG: alpha/beta hydrolase [Verrucomicrobiaceae bacterium]|nr:MAG: alpha/beta hydrolase [Verrucomicrobiaceae bacterium]